MYLSFSFSPEKLIEICREEKDIYDFLKEGFTHEFNDYEYMYNDILISHIDQFGPFSITAKPGELIYVIEFEEDKNNIFIEFLADDIDIGYEMSEEQNDLINNFIEKLNNDNVNSIKRISVKDLEEIDPDQTKIDHLYGFAVEKINPEQINAWSIHMVLKNGFTKELFKEKL